MFRVKYIGSYYQVSLIPDNIYTVLAVENKWYKIQDETGEEYFFPPEQFEIIEK